MTFTILSHAATLTLGLWLGINMNGISGAGSITAALNPSPKNAEKFFTLFMLLFSAQQERVYFGIVFNTQDSPSQ